jgi:mono/diheme cytochrome c family protein
MWLGSSGCSGPDAQLPASYRSVEVPAARLASAAARARGRALFLDSCALCHGEHADGRGTRREALGRAPRDFTAPAWRGAKSPRRVYYIIREGVRGTAMAAWKGALDEDQTWDLVAYLLSVGEAGADRFTATPRRDASLRVPPSPCDQARPG